MHILRTVFYTFPNVLIRRICFTIKSSLSWWSFPLFLWPSCVIQGWYCKEKFDCGHSQGSEGYFTFFSFSSQMEEMLEQQRRQQVREMLIAFFVCVFVFAGEHEKMRSYSGDKRRADLGRWGQWKCLINMSNYSTQLYKWCLLCEPQNNNTHEFLGCAREPRRNRLSCPALGAHFLCRCGPGN